MTTIRGLFWFSYIDFFFFLLPQIRNSKQAGTMKANQVVLSIALFLAVFCCVHSEETVEGKLVYYVVKGLRESGKDRQLDRERQKTDRQTETKRNWKTETERSK